LSEEAFLFGALALVAIGLFLYLLSLQMRQRQLERDAKLLQEMVRGGRKPG